jgi:hypothetical protein
MSDTEVLPESDVGAVFDTPHYQYSHENVSPELHCMMRELESHDKQWLAAALADDEPLYRKLPGTASNLNQTGVACCACSPACLVTPV